ncbi:sensor histidine kinase [Mumia sp. Pv 4-285]|uniref:sensor histidine kinase n=1 Tax=Mumia qirimensis TaxID=3234852 RepID=UPI00351D0EE5
MPRKVMAVILVAIGALVVLQLAAVAGSDSVRMLALDIAVAVASLALVPVLFRHPVPCGVTLGVLAALSPVATPTATMAALTVAAYRPFRSALVVAVAGVAGHLVLGWWRPVDGLPYAWYVLLVLVVYSMLVGWGAYARARRALLDSWRERVRRAERERDRHVAEARMAERTRIAREMHDVLAHRLSLLATYAGALEYRPDSPPERLAEAAGVVRAEVRLALGDLREVITLLRDEEALDDALAAPQPGLADVATLVEESRESGTSVTLDVSIDPAAVPEGTGRVVYRVVQEALTNSRRHAAGEPVHVTVSGEEGEALAITVRNAIGDGATANADGTGTGLIGVRERVELAGGTIDVERTRREFGLRAHLPWPS